VYKMLVCNKIAFYINTIIELKIVRCVVKHRLRKDTCAQPNLAGY